MKTKVKNTYLVFKALIGTSHDWAPLNEYECFFRIPATIVHVLEEKGGTYLTVGSHTKLPFVEQALVKIQDWLDKSPEEYEYNYQNGMIGAPTVGEARELIDEMLASVRFVMLNYSKEAWDYIYVFITH